MDTRDAVGVALVANEGLSQEVKRKNNRPITIRRVQRQGCGLG
jgi:hypothetical protein